MPSLHHTLALRLCLAVALAFGALALVPARCFGDVYMHNPRGSNNRACENNTNRNNDQRLFDSQNNDKGGYSCGRAWPFSCYTQENQALRNQCNEINSRGNDTMTPDVADNEGVKHPLGTRTPRMYFYEGSILQIEWTMQHGCGFNPRVICDIILQYACEDTLTDDCGMPGSGLTCGPRDGVPITNSNVDYGNVRYQSVNPQLIGPQDVNRNTRDQEATETIPISTDYNVQADPRFGRHETLAYYMRCFYRERNRGLFLADRNLGGNSARFTRQNNNGNRNGFECPEERDYWPYWADSPWKDIAVLTNRPERCADLVKWSQNVSPKQECDCPTCIAKLQLPIPSSRAGCTQAGGIWRNYPAYNIPPPVCGMAPDSRENHLGNPIGGGKSASHFNWTIPTNVVAGKTCIIRLRYNISSGDPIPGTNLPVDMYGDASLNGANSPIKDRQNSEIASYRSFEELPFESFPSARLGMSMNTNQFGRTFQDRSHSFSIVPAPVVGECAGKRILNLNMRGRRGNIVQVYPSVEYDFTPSEMIVYDLGDCVHVQFGGTDYGPAQDANNGFGGPPDPRNLNDGRGDRHNLVQYPASDQHHTVRSLDYHWQMFSTSRDRKLYLAFIGQPWQDTHACMPIEDLLALSQQAQTDNQNPLYRSTNGIQSNGQPEGGTGENFLDDNDDRMRYWRNCGKLSGARTPYFDGGLFVPGPVGTYAYSDTRNNCFTNRRVAGILTVQSSLLSSGNVTLVVVGGAAAMGLAGAGLLMLRRRRARKVVLGEGGAAAAPAAGGWFLPFGRRGSPPAGAISAPQKPAAPAAPVVPARLRPQAVPIIVASAPAPAAAAAAPVAAASGGGGAAAAAGTVVALYNHVASEPGELSFKKGDVITVTKRDSSGWWEGKLGGKAGLFPSNYVSQ